ncbi:SDR family oxidoreductase [Mucilaginibacter ginkgonis]|uniref:SDR family oxidoreductase n=1 Tax=Mucilaginibacter ginkgonis TaxID=2682091 RepID=A0A6I4I264_9SPHI|nr:SDR family oxidoreductase [Mucilaginibacter ginkgonis]QQL49376.1 SDR family oxidoreductase [Mucilaginibacter ginkgonis]
MKKVILVTGASSGLGLATANALAEKGHTVYGTSRNIEKIKAVSFKPIALDVTDDASVNDAITQIIKAEGRIDVLVNNAGNGITGPLYAMPVDFAKKQFEVNFFGVVRVCSAVLPHMIEQAKGLVINIGSLAGLFGLPYQGLYSASKFAIEGYSESLRMELQNTGVKVSVLNPGDFKTDFTGNREKVPFTLKNEKLEGEFNAAVAAMEKDESIGADPKKLAAQIVKIVDKSSPAHSYLVGAIGQTIVPTLKKVLPGGIFVKLMNDHYGIK